MGKISQDSAYNVSTKIVEPIHKKITEVNKEINKLLTGIYRETIPQDVMKFWSKHSNYMSSCGSVYPKGVGISSRGGESIESSPGTGGYSKDLDLTKEQASTYTKLTDKRDDLKTKYNDTRKEIEATILALGTHKNVAEQMPEALQFFPEGVKENKMLMIQLAPVREKVKCLVGTSEDKKCLEKIV